MFYKKDETMPQFADRFLRLVAFALVMMSISYAAAAVSHFLGGHGHEIAETIRAVFGLGAAAIIFVPFVRLMYLRAKNASQCKNEHEGFIAEVYAKSTVHAFAVGFVGMVFMEPFALKAFSDFPPAFFMQVTLSAMMATLGITFFIQSRESDGELDDEFDDLGDA